MCTVSFYPHSTSKFVLTSNRDESPNRQTLPPQIYTINNVNLLFPKDEVAGGTWIGASKHHRLICLLNGGFTSHERQESYRLSRGVIVTDLLTTSDFVPKIETYDFNGIEPFTIVLVDWKNDLQLYELVWDGIRVHFSEKPLAPHIWSSSLLYSEGIKKKRESWFSNFIFDNLRPSEAELLDFHKNAGEGSKEIDLIMDRGFVKTKSITQFSLGEENSSMRYEDLQSNEITHQTI